MITFTSSVDKVGAEKIFTFPGLVERDGAGWCRGGFAGEGVYVFELNRSLVVIGNRARRSRRSPAGDSWECFGVFFVTRYWDVRFRRVGGGYLLAGLVNGLGLISPQRIRASEWDLAIRWRRIGD